MCLHMPYCTPATVSPHVAPPCPLPRTHQVSPPVVPSESSEKRTLRPDVLSFVKDANGALGYVVSVGTGTCSTALKTGLSP